MQEIFTCKAWALETRFFHRISPLVLHRFQNGRDLSMLINNSHLKNAETPSTELVANVVGSWDRKLGMYVYENEDSGQRIAEVPLIGTLTKYGGMCSYGSMQYKGMINRANASKKIDAIVMVVDGPGGSVAGTTELGNAIHDSEKPIISFVDGMAASAHYWVTSQSDYIVANVEEYSEVGSIGVLCMLMNEKDWLVQEGIKVEIMRADQSVDKALLNSVEEWPQASLDQLQKELNKTAEDFKSAVLRGRGDRLNTSLENIFTGKMYDKETAQELGMIDYQDTLASTVMLAMDIASARKKHTLVN
ncbi:MAG: S49 family peptidase [Bacteroidota bacterium]